MIIYQHILLLPIFIFSTFIFNGSTQPPPNARKGIFTLDSYFEVTNHIFESTTGWLSEYTGLSELCPYRDEFANSINTSLSKTIKGQDIAVDAIVNAFAAWEFDKRGGYAGPLVLAITGPTGVGKSETSFQIAKAILSKQRRIRNTVRYIPSGLLVLRGEDYSKNALGLPSNTNTNTNTNTNSNKVDNDNTDTSTAYGTVSKSRTAGGGTVSSTVSSTGDSDAEDSVEVSNKMSEMHRSLKCSIVSHLDKCGGNGVILFDEVQKAVPGALEVFLPALEDRGSIMCPDLHEGQRYSTGNAVFIFVSDIGSEKMIELLLRSGTRGNIPLALLRSEVKKSLDAQWARLRLGKTIKDVIPFLPLERNHIYEIMQSKISNIAEAQRHKYWYDLVLDDNLAHYLSDSPFIDYTRYKTVLQRQHSSNSTSTSTGPSTVRKSFASWGARSIENGPLRTVRSLIEKYMQPYRPTGVLHVGLTDKSTTPLQMHTWGDGSTRTASTGTDQVLPTEEGLVYLQWCVLHEDAVHYIYNTHSTVSHNTACTDVEERGNTCTRTVDPGRLEYKPNTFATINDYYFSNYCETKWFGKL